ncbi:MAG TPA: hypothetical protein VFN35_22875 [Ktedonobacteraceae bacterium]|nr:hypothetical protein [Ktedonobacteraceae bacterium]
MNTFLELFGMCVFFGLLFSYLILVGRKVLAKKPLAPPMTRGRALGSWYYGGSETETSTYVQNSTHPQTTVQPLTGENTDLRLQASLRNPLEREQR